MLRSYFKIAFRNLWRHKVMSGINILGLATAIACCIMIALYVFHERGYDRFHKNADRIVRVTMEFASDGTPNKVGVTGNKVYPDFKRVFPEVENGVRTYPASEIVQYGNKVFDEKKFLYADSTFFNIFSFRLLRGNPSHALDKANQVVLTESSAQKYFGNEDPIGKTIRINNAKDYLITGISEDCPSASQIKFDFIASFYSLPEEDYKEESYFDASYYTYLLLNSPSSIKPLQDKIFPFLHSLDKTMNDKHYLKLYIQPLTQVHLYADVEDGLEPAGDYHYIYIFSVIALLILCIACANYVNLTTARATERAREVGVRKVMGALRKQLFYQFIGESIITVLIALLSALLLFKLLLPAFNQLASREFKFLEILRPNILLTLLIILFVIGLLGGSYPALVLSRFNPIKVLKGNFKTGAQGAWLRKSLIVIQFFISVGLIVCTLVIYSQLNFIQNKKIGYNRDQIVVLPVDSQIKEKLPALRSELLNYAAVGNITICNQLPTFIPGKYFLGTPERNMTVTAVRTDRNFVNTLQLKILAGNNFSEADQQFADSSIPNRPLLINETLAKSFGWSPVQAIGKPLDFQGRSGKVIGVINDFHFSSMHQSIGPIVLFLSNYTRNLLVKLNVTGNQTAAALQFMKEKWDALIPHRPFEYRFLDEEFNNLYSTETKTGRLFYFFAILAIALACLGLLGLATFTAQQRTKEIGIRKVLGASVTGIITMLLKDFLTLVIIAALIAYPITWWAMHTWLQSFAYRINLSWWIFGLAGGIAILIALFTISFQAIKAGLANPVKNLRTE